MEDTRGYWRLPIGLLVILCFLPPCLSVLERQLIYGGHPPASKVIEEKISFLKQNLEIFSVTRQLFCKSADFCLQGDKIVFCYVQFQNYFEWKYKGKK